jgi:diguanylate cyclase (GGDEF)-like protein/PAS domain S-box-containing protein
MSRETDMTKKSEHAGGQTVRLPGSARAVALHDQLYRYAEDLQQLIERNSDLEAHYQQLRATSSRLAESRDELDRLLSSSRDIHIVTDAAGVIVQSNPAGQMLAPLQALVGRKLQDWVLPSHLKNFRALLQSAADHGDSSEPGVELHLHRDNVDAPTLIVAAMVLAVRREGNLHFLHWVIRDVTHLRESEFETQLSTMVFKSSAEGILVTDLEGEIIAVNPAFSRITGYSAAEAIGRNPRMLSSGLQSREFYIEFWRALHDEGLWQGELFNRRKSGEIYPEWLTVTAVRDAEGRVISYIAVLSDLSRLLAAEKHLAYLAHYDTLTGLPNRHLFQDRLERTISQSKRTGAQFTLIFIDLDNFKRVNDTHGHIVGDGVLKEQANRLASTVRESDTVARLGGDEFVILAPGLIGATEIGRFCSKLVAAIGQPMLIEEHLLIIGGSFGCAEFPNHGNDGISLVRCADDAMYQAKRAGGGRHAIYDSGQTPVRQVKEPK